MSRRIPSESVDITKKNINKLKEMFPEILTDGEKIDFDILKTVLGEEVEDNNERYSFNWHGKKKSILGAQKPSKGTLRPGKEKSKNFDKTENLYIEGDNLEVLKLLQKSYSNKVKMIYIDPPYNTGNDFVYKDNFRSSVDNYLELTGQVDDQGNTLTTNSESNGRYHTDWLNMMYPRLKLAKNILANDGVIFISIDDNEQSNMKKMCDNIFGEKNFISNFVWYGGRKNDSKWISNSHEYVLIYVKNIEFLSKEKIRWREKKHGLERIYQKGQELFYKYGEDEASERLKQWFSSLDKEDPARMHKHYSNIDERGLYFKDNISWPGGGGPKYDIEHPKTNRPVKIPTPGWRYKKEKLIELIKDNRVKFGSDEAQVPTIKRYLRETETQVPISVLYNDNRGSMKRLRNLFEGKLYFEFPKDENVIQKFLSFIPMKDDDIIMDFFSGSATTAHATMKMNAEDGVKRKFIMVQLPELLNGNSEAYKEGYTTICDIAEERIRRAGEKVKKDLIEKNNKPNLLNDELVNPEELDIGFKVFKLDKSNIREWNSDFDNLEENLDLFEEVFVEGRSELDVVYEIILKNGLDLTYPVKKFLVENKNVYDIAHGNLFVCLDDVITLDIAQSIIDRRDEHGIETSTVVFKDSGFAGSDSIKLNVVQLLEDAGYPEDNILTI